MTNILPRKKTFCGCFMLSSLFFLSVFIMAVIFFRSLSIPTEYYQTVDIKNYGNYIGNRDNGIPAEFITSFFPTHISEHFANVVYSYRAENSDTYGFEAYLEFTIEDTELYDQYVKELTATYPCYQFQYHDDYLECEVSNKLHLNIDNDTRKLYIEEAKIGIILLSPAENKVIYIAIGVYDGGSVTVDSLCTFFDRFNIDPVIYAQNTNGIVSESGKS